ncbi:MAG: ATP-binding cassette domain-containing protein [Bacteroidales bacterium]
MYLLETQEIVKNYTGHLALNNVSIKVQEGCIYGLLGPNGAGKTTLIRIINQITAPDSGVVLIKGEKLNSKHIYDIGYLPEERGLYKKMKVGEQAIYLSQLKGLSKGEAQRRLQYWFKKFDILSWWDKKVEELSKGMQQKIQFIITILHEPKLLIFDEPFSGFDPINAQLLKEEILELKKKGSTIIFSTHNMSSVEEICDEIALINKSEKILDGRVEDIKRSFQSNLYEVLLESSQDPESFLTGKAEVLFHEKKEGSSLHSLKLKPEALLASTNDLLQLLIAHADVKEFKEVLPSMNDIFIQTVNQANHEK